MYDSQVNKRYKCICNTTALDYKPVKVKEDLLKGKSRKTYFNINFENLVFKLLVFCFYFQLTSK